MHLKLVQFTEASPIHSLIGIIDLRPCSESKLELNSKKAEL